MVAVVDVRGLQLALSAQGFDPGPIDGIPGPRTTAAVRFFQAARGLVVDGIPGPVTQRALGIVPPARGPAPFVVRGLRNNNPGCIRIGPSNWVGELPVDPRIEAEFERFDTHINGIRALTIVLGNYQRKYGLNTVDAIVDRYAPPVENDTEAYKRAVAERIGIARAAPLGLSLGTPPVMQSLVAAIIAIECGGLVYPAADVAEGVARGLTRG